MSKVIQKITSIPKSFQSLKYHLSPHSSPHPASHSFPHSPSLLHRGQKSSSDPYNEKKLNFGPTRLLQKTLGTSRPNTRCSRTFQTTNNAYNNIYNNNHSQLNSYITKSKYTRVAGISSTLALLVLSTLFLHPIIRNLNSAEAVSKDSTTTLTVASDTSASVELLVKDNDGTFAKSTTSQLANFSVITNNASGYNLTIKGKDSTYSSLTNSETSTSLTSISGTMTESGFKSSSSNGIWGYLPSKLNSANNTNYKSAPNNTTGDLIDETATANASTANDYTIGLGVKANYATPAGTYTNTFVITATGNGTPYSITYADNTGDTISNLPARSYSDSGITDTTVALSSTIPTRSGYTFTKWCKGTVSGNGTSCSGTTYTAGSSYGIDRTAATNTATLYAMWSPNITIKAVDGATVSLNGTSCNNTSGCTITSLKPGTSYNLAATIANTDKHSFTAWTLSSTTDTGSIASTSSASTNYTVGTKPVTITPTLTVNKYTCTKQYRTQTATGTWGSYTTDTTEQVAYGETCSYSKSITNYTGVSGTNSQAGTANGTMTASGLTLQVSMYRNTHTVALTKGTGISAVAVTGNGVKSGSGSASATVYYGGAVTIAATLSSGYDWVNWTGSATYTNQSQSISSVTSNLAFTANGKSSAPYMQNVTPSDCTTTAKTAIDSRDNQEYTIQRLADGKCWMMTNLNLGAVTLTTDLTSANTHFTGTISASTWNGYKKTSSSQTYTAAEYIPLTTSNTSDGLDTDSTSGTAYGTLYNYCAASAGTICTDSNSSNATYDICPKGWRLPTGEYQSGEFYILYNNSSYNSYDKMRASIANGGAAFALAGILDSSTPTLQGDYGYYWSSTRPDDNTGMRGLSLHTSYVYPVNRYNRNTGLSIRCVRDDTIADATYLQEVTSRMVINMSTGETATLKDRRDNQAYTIAKLADGKLWMTKNLAIGCAGSGSSYSDSVSSKTLTSSDSNVSSNYTTPTSSSHSNTTAAGRIVCDSTYGAWYNYYAATAGTISGYSNKTNATYDICPKGWRLPTSSEFYGITSYADAFSPSIGGYYSGGSLSATGYGYWWSATKNSSTNRNNLRYDGSSLNANNGNREYGYYVRCIQSS